MPCMNLYIHSYHLNLSICGTHVPMESSVLHQSAWRVCSVVSDRPVWRKCSVVINRPVWRVCSVVSNRPVWSVFSGE